MTWVKRLMMLAITVGLLALTIRVVGVNALLAGWNVLNAWTILAALGCGLLTTGAQALRWKLLLGLKGTTLTWRRAMADCYSSSLLNMILPGGLSGDLARVAVYRNTGDRKWVSPLSVVGAERLTATTLLFATASVTLVNVSTSVALITSGIALLALLLSLLGMRGISFETALIVWVTAAVSLSSLLILYLIAMFALGGPVIPVLAVVGLASMSIPLGVGGWGVREISVSLLAVSLATTAEWAVSSSTGYGILATVSTLPGAITVMLATFRPRRSSEKVTQPSGSTQSD